MSESIVFLSPLFWWVLKASLQGSFMVSVIILLQLLLRNRLGSKVVYCLWLMLIVRLIIPWAPQSKFSLYNLMPRVDIPQAVGNQIQPITNADMDLVSTEGFEEFMEPAEESKASQMQGTSHNQFSKYHLPAFFWFGGAIVVGCWIILANFMFWRRVYTQSPVTSEPVLNLLEECKRTMNIHTYFAVVETDRINTPALYGVIRPRLLLPLGTIESLDTDQLRYVFLHELAHLKRNDILVGYLATFLQVVHWFNPLIWYAFYRMRCDRELTCDGLALSNITDEESADYGRTIVHFLEKFSQPCRLCSTAGVLEDQSQLKRRMKMIAKFSKRTYRWSTWAVILLVAVGMTSLTNGQQENNGKAKLNEMQKVYEDWTNKTFGSYLERGKYDDAPKEAKEWAGKKALTTLRKGSSAGREYYVAINTIGELKFKDGLLPLLKIATDKAEKNNRDRWMATRAIGILGDKRAVAKLIHLVYHPNPNTRMWSQISLVRLTGQNFGYDYMAWGKWWNSKGNKPSFKPLVIKWTKNPEYADPVKQKQADADFFKKIQGEQSGKSQETQDDLRAKVGQRYARDKENYTVDQLREVESLYKVVSKNKGSQEAKDSLNKMLEKYPKATRTGCALQYVGQMSSGREREAYLKKAIESYGDCYYGSGVNVGAYARLYLAGYYKETGRTREAVKLWKEIMEQYPDAVNHKGRAIKDSVQKMIEQNM